MLFLMLGMPLRGLCHEGHRQEAEHHRLDRTYQEFQQVECRRENGNRSE